MLCNTNNVDNDILNKWCLYIIEITLKSRLMNIIDCYDDNIINKYIQVINSAIKKLDWVHRLPIGYVGQS